MPRHREPIKHGTTGGYRAHHRHGEPMCEACRDANRRARGQRPKGAPEPCGSRAAYSRHLRRGEEPCEPCRAANAAAGKAFRKTHTLPPGDPRHGSINGYGNHRCRCQLCRKANAERSARRRRELSWNRRP